MLDVYQRPPPQLMRLVGRPAFDGVFGQARKRQAAIVELLQLAVQLVAVLLAEPPAWMRVEPYLSLNRGPFSVAWDRPDPDRIVRAEPFEGVEPVPWRPPADGTVVVDDLDPGFRPVEPERRGWRLRGRGRRDEELDQGLPVGLFAHPTARWSRGTLPGAFGRYRHTWAFRAAGGADVRAEYEAVLPRAGRWTLEVHVPRGRFLGGASPLADLQVEVVPGEGETHGTRLGAAAVGEGWNRVDAWDLPAGTVIVRTWGDDPKKLLYADAIRWVPPAADTGAGDGGDER